MPLIVLSGYPCSGLSYRAQQLASLLEATQDELFKSGAIPASRPRYKIHIVPTHDPSHPRTVYDHARTEKEARGVAYARAKRALGRDSFVILDGMNYIKGYSPGRKLMWNAEGYVVGTRYRSLNRTTKTRRPRKHRRQTPAYKSKRNTPPSKTPKNHTPPTSSRTSSSATKNPAPTAAGTNPSSPSPGAILNPPSPRSGPR
ncbi:hypothetical protein CNMCM6106_008506 [Aspergillus hiratsukae]|uniref:Chromatin associated protein KTI12 n=1 Tax=Aspergillus hiratsukae TaxID=1194566 RepID=A0A8H6V188_9EURO|nr:hypothetical protein CNMCM6106_008506 [Aspergillus hiratsukae]